MTTPNITWKVTNLEALPQHDGKNNVVSVVHWRCFAEQDGMRDDIYNTVGIPYDPQANFTPLESLTEAQVLAWIYAHGVDKAATEAAAVTRLNDKLNPPVIYPTLPWSA